MAISVRKAMDKHIRGVRGNMPVDDYRNDGCLPSIIHRCGMFSNETRNLWDLSEVWLKTVVEQALRLCYDRSYDTIVTWIAGQIGCVDDSQF